MRPALFLAAEDGGVSVDWVVMSAGVVRLGLVSLIAVSDGTSSLGHDISDSLAGVAAGVGVSPDDYGWYAHDPDALDLPEKPFTHVMRQSAGVRDGDRVFGRAGHCGAGRICL